MVVIKKIVELEIELINLISKNYLSDIEHIVTVTQIGETYRYFKVSLSNGQNLECWISFTTETNQWMTTVRESEIN